MDTRTGDTARPTGPARWWHTEVRPGRFTARVDRPLAVFLIGARINRPLRVRRWWWVMRSMPAMMEALADEPGLGLLHVENFSRGRTSISVQYWDSMDQLLAFAADRDSPHLAAWHRWNQQLRSRDDVGIWHETYAVEPGGHESIYGNMPLFGMAAARGSTAVGPRADRARQRLGTRVA